MPFLKASAQRGYITVALGLNASDTANTLFSDKNCSNINITLDNSQVSLTHYAANDSLPCSSFIVSSQVLLDMVKQGESGFAKLCLAIEEQAMHGSSSFVLISEVDICDEKKVDSVVSAIRPQALLPVPLGRSLIHMARINSKFSLPGITHDCALNCTDKLRVHELQDNEGCVHSAYVLFETNALTANLDECAKNLVGDMSFPLILKPRFGSGSHGISVCQNMDELTSNLALLRDGPATEYLLETYLKHDYEFSINGLVLNGKLKIMLPINKCAMTKLPARQEISYSTNYDIERFAKVIEDELNKNIKALNIQNAIFNADTLFNLETNEASVVDIAARHPGNNISSILAFCDISLIDLWFDYVVLAKEMSDELAHAMQQEFYARFKNTSLFSSFFALRPGRILSCPSEYDLQKLLLNPKTNEVSDLNYFLDVLYPSANGKSDKGELMRFELKVKAGDVISTLCDCAVTRLGQVHIKHVSALQGLNILKEFMFAFEMEDESEPISVAV